MTDLDGLEQTLGFVFLDKSLLQRALVHRSYLNEHPEFPLEDNERLEFLGDAVLDFLTAEYLYHRFPEATEGLLTSLRAALVRRETLARFAKGFGLGDHLLLGHGEAASGGRERPVILCAVFEAVVGALYLDRGIATVQRLIEPLMQPVIDETIENESDKDHKSMLQELAQGLLHRTPRYSTVAESGPDHAKEFTVQVSVAGRVLGHGTGKSKQQAAQRAARVALERFHTEMDAALGASLAPDAEPPA